jgi:hypothetical protein
LVIVVGVGAEGVWLLDGVRAFFFFGFFVTIAQVVAGATGAGFDGGGGGGGGTRVDSGLAVG